MRPDCEIRALVLAQLHAAGDGVRAAGLHIEHGDDCVSALREMLRASAALDEARVLLAAHEAQTCLDILAASDCPEDLHRASDRLARTCAA